jgi:hypothetical protein
LAALAAAFFFVAAVGFVAALAFVASAGKAEAPASALFVPARADPAGFRAGAVIVRTTSILMD